MNLRESLGDLVLRCERNGTADITTVATLLEGARAAGFFSAVIEKGPDDPPAPTASATLTEKAAVAATREKPSPDPKPDPDPKPVEPAPSSGTDDPQQPSQPQSPLLPSDKRTP